MCGPLLQQPCHHWDVLPLNLMPAPEAGGTMAARMGFEDQRQGQQYPNWAGKMLTKINETAKVQDFPGKEVPGDTPTGQEE